ncbi:acyltransferase family protein [Psychroflexus sp. MES1-P1E]|jgi:glucan biosynthesis protein C|uniref:acyltransferase family protein n=1 Tax=Psychroflexus sp. MES1-P1E TaxID=2058320 RepID=UPI000C7DEEF6|nr:acyltransferase family protein [Psychroflexus sp. MES1-P1E]PKG42762.1 glucan biosynthesis protein [Psychroflexus sp. MES1-P1E]
MRRHDIDWLRVLVFGLLIFYHTGKFFDPGDFHIKNNILYDWLKLPMYFLNRWRLPILFVISGMGTYFALNKRSSWQFSKERIVRLFIPLVFGMLFIVPPQVYIERLTDNDFLESYFVFWKDVAFIGEYPEGNLSWHHLWFLPYLLLFSLLWLPIFKYIKKYPANKLMLWLSKQIKKPLGLFWFCLPLILIELTLEPYFPKTHALVGDWYLLTKFSVLFGYGFILIHLKDIFWKSLESYRKLYATIAVLAFSVLYVSVWIMKDTYFSYALELIIIPINYWSWILTFFGFAAKYLNKTSEKLRYANEAVYPFYILHQTITIIIGYYIMNLDWGFLLKFSTMIIGTFLGSWILYEFGIRRLKYIRPLFGLKKRIK